MVEPIKITIPGEPLPKMRARSFIRNGTIMTFDPQNKEKEIVRSYLLFHPKKPPNLQLEALYHVKLTFHMPIASSSSTVKRNLLLWNIENHETPHTCDVDNLIKFTLDCGNGILWYDDRWISKIKSEEYYSDNPRTEIEYMILDKQILSPQIESVMGVYSPRDVRDLCDKLHTVEALFIQSLETKTEINRAENLSAALFDLAVAHADMLKKILQKSRRSITTEDKSGDV